MAAAIANYLLAQLMAMGHVVAGLSDGAIPYAAGVLVLTAAILGYELLGGLRAVAWTDCLQGILLAIGLFGLLAATVFSGESVGAATAWILENQPEKAFRSGRHRAGHLGQHPPADRLFGSRLSAGDPAHLRRPERRLASQGALGSRVSALPHHPAGLPGRHPGPPPPERTQRDRRRSGAARAAARLGVRVGVDVLDVHPDGGGRGGRHHVHRRLGVADPVLDAGQGFRVPGAAPAGRRGRWREARITRIGKGFSLAIMGVLVAIALTPRISLWGLLELKMELLVQAAPVFVLGLTWRRLSARAALGRASSAERSSPPGSPSPATERSPESTPDSWARC